MERVVASSSCIGAPKGFPLLTELCLWYVCLVFWWGFDNVGLGWSINFGWVDVRVNVILMFYIQGSALWIKFCKFRCCRCCCLCWMVVDGTCRISWMFNDRTVRLCLNINRQVIASLLSYYWVFITDRHRIMSPGIFWNTASYKLIISLQTVRNIIGTGMVKCRLMITVL